MRGTPKLPRGPGLAVIAAVVSALAIVACAQGGGEGGDAPDARIDAPPAVGCGDGTCAADEGPLTCPQDCGVGNRMCGDGMCTPGENEANCAQDCGPRAVCGDGMCNLGETYQSCPQDCPAPPMCGDGACNGTETPQTCPQDCGTGGTCAHSECVTGAALDPGCSSCATQVCFQDFWCCFFEWDQTCVEQAYQLCPGTCS